MFVVRSDAQERSASLRIEVLAGLSPVAQANVTINGNILQTDPDGVLSTSVRLGDVRIVVAKDGFFPTTVSVTVGEVRNFDVRVELQPQKKLEEEVKVYSTRNDVRIEDSPLHVEVLQSAKR